MPVYAHVKTKDGGVGTVDESEESVTHVFRLKERIGRKWIMSSMRRPCLRVPYTLPNSFPERRSRPIRDRLDAGEWSNTLKRRVQHFGYLYDYRARAVTVDAYLGKLPPWLETLA